MTSLLLAVAALIGGAHPNDGPDLDLRVRVEDDQVVFQILMNLVFCDEITKLEREVEDDLAPHEEEPLGRALAAYYRKGNTVEIDGVRVEPEVTGYDVPEPELSLLPLLPRFGMRALFKVRLELTYPVTARPERVHVKWGPFPPDYALGFEGKSPPMEIPAVFLAEGDEQVALIFHEEPEYTWHRPTATAEDRFVPVPDQGGRVRRRVEIPVVSAVILAVLLVAGMISTRRPSWRRPYAWISMIGLVAAAACWSMAPMEISIGSTEFDLSEEEAVEIFTPLHRNIYRAFDYSKESDIYDALARSVHGDLLESLYGEVFRSLVMQEEGGALSRVKEVDVLSARLEHAGVMPGFDAEGFQITARWRVKGRVFHFGHAHERTNEYAALYGVVRTEDGWRIAANQTIEQRLIEATSPTPVGGQRPVADPAKKASDGK